jgi:uncharacterized RDD family membrane protein YckC
VKKRQSSLINIGVPLEAEREEIRGMNQITCKQEKIKARLYAAILDYFIVTTIGLLIQILSEKFYLFYFGEYTVINYSGIIVAFSCLLFKDSIGSRSIGKRKYHLSVIDDKSGKNASVFKCILRNIPLILITPIEAIMITANSPKRIGDLIAGTRVRRMQ